MFIMHKQAAILSLHLFGTKDLFLAFYHHHLTSVALHKCKTNKKINQQNELMLSRCIEQLETQINTLNLSTAVTLAKYQPCTSGEPKPVNK
jgi:hypothetical protein